MDTEDDDEFSVGCAGGIDTNTMYTYEQEDVSSDYVAVKIELKGLKGGHSGMDIHLGRGNANKWMNRLMYALTKVNSFRIVDIEGGSLRNAIPRESVALVVCKANDKIELDAVYKETTESLLFENRFIEKAANFNTEGAELPEKMMAQSDQEKIIAAIYTMPNAVWSMSPTIAGLVETSSSLAKVIIRNGEFITQSLQRSMSEVGKNDVATAIRLNFELLGASVITQSGDYPGWTPNPNSAILNIMKDLYVKSFNEEPKVAACHAGLECGILSKHLPGCDMISFGPTIKNPHSPDEKVNIKSVEKFWGFLQKVLLEIPKN